jgi:TonB family protein
MKRSNRLWLLAALTPCLTLAVAEETPVRHLDDDGHERVPLDTVAPAYPAVARRDRIEGDVQVCFNVDRQGRPYRIAVRSSTNRVFEKPSIRAIRASRYQPLPEGQEVPAIKTCRTFRFRLESATAD